MVFNRRQLVISSVAAGVSLASPAGWSQTAKASRKLVLGQSVPLTGAADQIGLAYMNGAKICFDALNAKNGVGGYRVELRTLDDGYEPSKAAGNAKRLIEEGVDALFGFAGTASCDAAFAAAKPSGTVFFAPFAASDDLHDAALSNVFHVRPALADEAFKVARHCATLNQDRIAVFAEDIGGLHSQDAARRLWRAVPHFFSGGH